jgi:hypothetical protein
VSATLLACTFFGSGERRCPALSLRSLSTSPTCKGFKQRAGFRQPYRRACAPANRTALGKSIRPEYFHEDEVSVAGILKIVAERQEHGFLTVGLDSAAPEDLAATALSSPLVC